MKCTVLGQSWSDEFEKYMNYCRNSVDRLELHLERFFLTLRFCECFFAKGGSLGFCGTLVFPLNGEQNGRFPFHPGLAYEPPPVLEAQLPEGKPPPPAPPLDSSKWPLCISVPLSSSFPLAQRSSPSQASRVFPKAHLLGQGWAGGSQGGEAAVAGLSSAGL